MAQCVFSGVLGKKKVFGNHFYYALWQTGNSAQVSRDKYDPFKNSQIVLFVYIIQGAIHGPSEVVEEGVLYPTNDYVDPQKTELTQGTHDYCSRK